MAGPRERAHSLIRKGVDVRKAGMSGSAPLQAAAELLVKGGASVDGQAARVGVGIYPGAEAQKRDFAVLDRSAPGEGASGRYVPIEGRTTRSGSLSSEALGSRQVAVQEREIREREDARHELDRQGAQHEVGPAEEGVADHRELQHERSGGRERDR